jgi:hypothetical protein
LAAVVVGLLLLALLAWSATGWGLVGAPMTAYDAAPAPADPASCAVTYHVRVDGSGRFVADITADPGGVPPADGWRLAVQLPDGTAARTAGGWQAEGAMLTSPAQPALTDGTSAFLTLTGRRTAGDVNVLTLPTEIYLDGQECEVSADGTITARPPAAPPVYAAPVLPEPEKGPVAKGHRDGRPGVNPMKGRHGPRGGAVAAEISTP